MHVEVPRPSRTDLRDDLRNVVAAIAPFDDAEADAHRSVLRWVDSGEALYRESGSASARHLAVYFTLVDPADDAVLQIHHVKAEAWMVPGGHVDTESPCDAVVREAAEELGITATFHPAVGRNIVVRSGRSAHRIGCLRGEIDLFTSDALRGDPDLCARSDHSPSGTGSGRGHFLWPAPGFPRL